LFVFSFVSLLFLCYLFIIIFVCKTFRSRPNLFVDDGIQVSMTSSDSFAYCCV